MTEKLLSDHLASSFSEVGKATMVSLEDDNSVPEATSSTRHTGMQVPVSPERTLPVPTTTGGTTSGTTTSPVRRQGTAERRRQATVRSQGSSSPKRERAPASTSIGISTNTYYATGTGTGTGTRFPTRVNSREGFIAQGRPKTSFPKRQEGLLLDDDGCEDVDFMSPSVPNTATNTTTTTNANTATSFRPRQQLQDSMTDVTDHAPMVSQSSLVETPDTTNMDMIRLSMTGMQLTKLMPSISGSSYQNQRSRHTHQNLHAIGEEQNQHPRRQVGHKYKWGFLSFLFPNRYNSNQEDYSMKDMRRPSVVAHFVAERIDTFTRNIDFLQGQTQRMCGRLANLVLFQRGRKRKEDNSHQYHDD